MPLRRRALIFRPTRSAGSLSANEPVGSLRALVETWTGANRAVGIRPKPTPQRLSTFNGWGQSRRVMRPCKPSTRTRWPVRRRVVA